MSPNVPSILRAPHPSEPEKQDLGEGLVKEGGVISAGWGMREVGVWEGLTEAVELGLELE